jgi:predicted nuclease of predicted toxin-antitoxin system
MKLLLDQGLPRSTVTHLAANGIVAVHVGDLGMAAATDTAILKAARQRQEVVVTMDAEFHQLLAVSQAKSPSVIRIRIEGLKGVALASVLNQVGDRLGRTRGRSRCICHDQ